MIKIDVPAGKYVVAVSGGVDSMVLLDLLAKQSELKLVVAHFEHGIRPDSDEDRKLVEQAAAKYNLPFVFERGYLGTQASEATAREARYNFLRKIKAKQGAKAIITAHHQDDMLETAILNILRGTGRKGLSSLASGGDILRPLLHVSKKDIYEYAHSHPRIAWREDITNAEERYLRNYIRQRFVAKLGDHGRQLLLEYITRAATANPLIDTMLEGDIKAYTTREGLSRHWFIMLPYDVSAEVMAAWLRSEGIREFDRRTISRLVVAAKTARPGKLADINAGYLLKVHKTHLQLCARTAS